MPDQPPKIVGVLEGVFHDTNFSLGMDSRLVCERIQHDATAGSREPSVALSEQELYFARRIDDGVNCKPGDVGADGPE